MEPFLQSVAAVDARHRKEKACWLSGDGHRPPLQLTSTLAIILGLCLAVLLPSRAQTGPNDDVGTLAKVTLHIGQASLATQIAATPAQEERGLMYVTKLPDNDGMLFVLPLGHAEFWMKNTLIPLSVAYTDKNGVILEIHDMQPADPSLSDDQIPRTRSDSDQVAYALETNLHWFALNGIKPGDKITPPPGTLVPQATSK